MKEAEPDRYTSVKEFKSLLRLRMTMWKDEQIINDVSIPGIPEVIWAPSDLVMFPKTLSRKERHIVHSISSKLGLFHMSCGDGEDRFISISKSGDFTTLLSQYADNNVMNVYENHWFDATVPKPCTIPLYYHSSNYIQQQLRIKEKKMKQMQQSPQLHETYFIHIKPSLHNIEKYQDIMTCIQQKDLSTLSIIQDIDSTTLKENTINDSIDISHLDSSNNDVSSDYSVAYPGELIFQNVYFISTYTQLLQVIQQLMSCDEFAFDCEMHSFRTYYPITCLLQLSLHTVHYIIDTIALWDHIGTLLGPIFENPKIVKIGHGISSMDVPCLYRDFGIVIINVFDTQLAAVNLGIRKNGLVGVLDRYKCPISIEMSTTKDKMKSTDWRCRPLSYEMMKYAILDVYYLIPLYFCMCADLIDVAISPDTRTPIESLLQFNQQLSDKIEKAKKKSISNPRDKKADKKRGNKNSNNGRRRQSNTNSVTESILINTNGRVIDQVKTDTVNMFSIETTLTNGVKQDDSKNDNDNEEEDSQIIGEEVRVFGDDAHLYPEAQYDDDDDDDNARTRHFHADDEHDESDGEEENGDYEAYLQTELDMSDEDAGNEDEEDDDMWEGWGDATTTTATTTTASVTMNDTTTIPTTATSTSTSTSTTNNSNIISNGSTTNNGTIAVTTTAAAVSTTTSRPTTNHSNSSNSSNNHIAMGTAEVNIHSSKVDGDNVTYSHIASDVNIASTQTRSEKLLNVSYINDKNDQTASDVKNSDKQNSTNNDSNFTTESSSDDTKIPKSHHQNTTTNLNSISIGKRHKRQPTITMKLGSLFAFIITLVFAAYIISQTSGLLPTTNNISRSEKIISSLCSPQSTVKVTGNDSRNPSIQKPSLTSSSNIINYIIPTNWFSPPTPSTTTMSQDRDTCISTIQMSESMNDTNTITEASQNDGDPAAVKKDSRHRHKFNRTSHRPLSYFGKVMMLLVSIGLAIAAGIDCIRVSILNQSSLILYGEEEDDIIIENSLSSSSNSNSDDTETVTTTAVNITNKKDIDSFTCRIEDKSFTTAADDDDDSIPTISKQQQQHNDRASLNDNDLNDDKNNKNNNSQDKKNDKTNKKIQQFKKKGKMIASTELLQASYVTSHDLNTYIHLSEIKEVFMNTMKICAGLWSPPAENENVSGKNYARISGFKERKNHKKHPWSPKTIYIFKCLFIWREKEARLRDESPGYICPSNLLLDAAERLPLTLKELTILSYPLPHSMREECVNHNVNNHSSTVYGPVNLIDAIHKAIIEWEMSAECLQHQQMQESQQSVSQQEETSTLNHHHHTDNTTTTNGGYSRQSSDDTDISTASSD